MRRFNPCLKAEDFSPVRLKKQGIKGTTVNVKMKGFKEVSRFVALIEQAHKDAGKSNLTFRKSSGELNKNT